MCWAGCAAGAWIGYGERGAAREVFFRGRREYVHVGSSKTSMFSKPRRKTSRTTPLPEVPEGARRAGRPQIGAGGKKAAAAAVNAIGWSRTLSSQASSAFSSSITGPETSQAVVRGNFSGPSATRTSLKSLHGRTCGVSGKVSSCGGLSPCTIPAPKNRRGAFQPASFFFTSCDTSPMSAWPASRGLSTAISLPMSAGPEAPVSATAASIAACTEASSILAGR